MMKQAIITGFVSISCSIIAGCTGTRANHIKEACGLISTTRLTMLPWVHLSPIYLVVYQEALREYLSWSVLRA